MLIALLSRCVFLDTKVPALYNYILDSPRRAIQLRNGFLLRPTDFNLKSTLLGYF